MLEKFVLSCASSCLNSHNLYTFQSAYCPGNSTETALPKAVNDLSIILNKVNMSMITLFHRSSTLSTNQYQYPLFIYIYIYILYLYIYYIYIYIISIYIYSTILMQIFYLLVLASNCFHLIQPNLKYRLCIKLLLCFLQTKVFLVSLGDPCQQNITHVCHFK